MYLKSGAYTTTNSDLKIIVHKVAYQTDDWAKIKVTLTNKHNDIIYETCKKYTVIKENIKHWKRMY